MPDTGAARAAIREAYDKHRSVMGGMSTAMLKLEAAGGLYRDDDPPPSYTEDDPVWINHALSGLKDALEACDALDTAVTAAFNETGKLLPGVQVTIRRSPARKEVPSVPQVRAWLFAHGWTLRGTGQAGEAWNPPTGAAWVALPDTDDDPAFLASQIGRIADREGRDADEVRREMLEVPDAN